jgi:hypothetical protein
MAMPASLLLMGFLGQSATTGSADSAQLERIRDRVTTC